MIINIILLLFVVFLLLFILLPRVLRTNVFGEKFADKIEYKWSLSDQPEQIKLKGVKKGIAFLPYLDSYFYLILLTIINLPMVLMKFHRIKVQSAKCKMQNAKFLIPMGEQFGIVISSHPETVNLLKELNINNALLRIKFEEELEHYEELVKELYENNINIIIAILQNREALKNINRWEEFLINVFDRFNKYSQYYQIGIAPNRKKWGIWDYREYIKLLKCANKVRKGYKNIKLLAPAVIDFEWHFTIPILNNCKNGEFDIFTQLLYVDRGGAPENGLMNKINFLKAIADNKPFWITEVNWPIKDKGDYQPAHGEKREVTEDGYANYLVRYYILALTTGYVNKIFWHQLIHFGFGLSYEEDGKLIKRDAFYAYKTMINELKNSKFVEERTKDELYHYIFEKDNENIAIIWHKNNQQKIELPKECYKIVDRDGKMIKVNKEIVITERPYYFHLIKKFD